MSRLDAPAPEAESDWPEAEPAGPPAADRLVVWLFDLDRPPLPRSHLADLLAPDERERAARFRFDVHRDRFVAGRGVLREVLGRALGRPAPGLEFRYGAKGKPSLAPGSSGGLDLRFNLSHSRNLGLLALGHGRELGVDIEALEPLDDAAALVERFFAPAERRHFARQAEERRLACFYAGWTRKEAYVKARGDGLSLPTTAFELEIDPDGDPRLLAFDEEPEEVGRWSFRAFEPARGFLGAVTVEGEAPPVETRLWRGRRR